jgi:RHS repeat-associated protein
MHPRPVAVVAAVVLASLTARAVSAAQSPPYGTIAPGSGSYTVGTQLQVHVEFCSPSSFFDAWGTVWLNGVTIGSTEPWPLGPGCSDFQAGDFTITIGEGANTVSAQVSDNVGTAYVEATYNGTPPPPTPPIVTPDGATRVIAPVAGARIPFSVKNTDAVARAFTFGVTCTGVVTSCTAPGPVTVGAGQSLDVWPTFSVAGTTFQTGNLNLTATAQDAPNPSDGGSVIVTLAPAGAVLDRGACLTIAAGKGAAFECGDLRLVHALPQVRTLNKAKAPVLLYNSQHAHPYPLVTADVTLAAPDPLPTTVRAILRINGTQVAQRDWPGSTWVSPGQTRRIVVGFDADTLSTNVYDYDLEVQRITGSSVTTLQTRSEPLSIVNRRNSPFGPGWWLAGYERLYFGPSFTVIWQGGQFTIGPNAVVWVGGEGSFRVYQRAGVVGTDTVFLAPPLDHPDTLRHTANNEWKRLLPGGDTVVFSSAGLHLRTANRLGYRHLFTDSSGFLVRIEVPPDSSLKYRFTYSGSPARLTQVTIPDSATGTYRVTSLVWAGDSVRITDPGVSAPVTFRYQPGGTNRIQSRKSPLGALTEFAYDAGNRLATARLGLSPSDSINVSFCAAEVRGLATCSPNLVSPDSAYTILDGPRTDSADVVHFWVTDLGSPWKIRDPYGYVTTITMAEPSWPALATRVQYPNGRVLGATYDARGNIATSTDSNLYVAGQHATTRYTWHQRWDRITEIIAPAGNLIRFSYDAVNGNRLWQEDGRGAISRVTFGYATSGFGAGLVRSVAAPGGATDSIFYDLLGNVQYTKSPLGWATYLENDRLGRTTRVLTPVNTAQSLFRDDSTFYDQRGIAYRTVSYGPAISYASPTYNVPAQRLVVERTYNDEGLVTRIDRKASPDTTKVITTQWLYDLAGRQIVEIDAAGLRDSAVYDAAGNVTRQVPRRRPGVPPTDLVYDRLNRLVMRSIPQDLNYPKRAQTLTYLHADDDSTDQPFNRMYPWFPSEANGDLKIPADTVVFRYDAAGALTIANNRWARIKRSYFKDGSIDRDSLWIRNLGDTSFSHAYGIRYGYDLNGRVISVGHPDQLAPATSTTRATLYGYDPLTGNLVSVTDALGNSFQFAYSTRGERIRTALPGSIVDTVMYDLDGRVVGQEFKNYNTTSPWHFSGAKFRSDVLTYADPVRVATSSSSMGYREISRSRYSGLGHLAWFMSSSYGSITGSGALLTNLETSTGDGLGNTLTSRDSSTFQRDDNWVAADPPVVRNRFWSYHYPTGRLTSVADSLYRIDHNSYDEGGNLYETKTGATLADSQPVLDERASYFDADNRLRFAESRRLRLVRAPSNCLQLPYPQSAYCWELEWPWAVSFEEYRYDALGRRVLVLTRQDCGTFSQTSLMHCNIGTIRRTVWAGSSELYEIQQYAGRGSTLASAAQMENDTSTSASFVLPGTFPIAWDPNPKFGRVGYTNGPGIDQPLGVTRIALVDTAFVGSDRARHLWAPFVIVPHWNWRGRADYGTFGDGGTNLCWTSASSRCVSLVWRAQPFVLASTDADTATRWFGTVLTMKRDASGLHFKRNRYLDPNTGRFTQEDPIGLAGGLNLYGFAGGDPVNFSDPFGLCPWHDIECWDDKMWAASGGTGLAGRVLAPLGSTVFEATGMSGVDRQAKDAAASGSKTQLAMLVATIAANAAPLLRWGSRGVRLVIGKMDDLAREGAVGAGEVRLVLGDLGTPRANWAQNARALRAYMSTGRPIRDASVNPLTGELLNNTGFLRAERELLRNRGWTYDASTTLWNPPVRP